MLSESRASSLASPMGQEHASLIELGDDSFRLQRVAVPRFSFGD
jgi:hypothetical protein